MSEPRLTPEQKLRAAVAVLCDHVDQHVVASLFGVNHGRVNEAVQTARKAFGFPPGTVVPLKPVTAEQP